MQAVNRPASRQHPRAEECPLSQKANGYGPRRKSQLEAAVSCQRPGINSLEEANAPRLINGFPRGEAVEGLVVARDGQNAIPTAKIPQGRDIVRAFGCDPPAPVHKALKHQPCHRQEHDPHPANKTSIRQRNTNATTQ